VSLLRGLPIDLLPDRSVETVSAWLKEEDLKAEEQENLQQLRQVSPDLETAYQLVKEDLAHGA
jgi:hypothetical protein